MYVIASSSRHEGSCHGGCRGALAVLYVRLFEKALGRLAFLVLRQQTLHLAPCREWESLDEMRLVLIANVGRVEQWAHDARGLHGWDCERIAELVALKRRLVAEARRHERNVAAVERVVLQ